MISIADNPSVLQQLTRASEASQLPDPASVDVAQNAADPSEPSTYPSKKLELIEGRYRALGTEK